VKRLKQIAIVIVIIASVQSIAYSEDRPFGVVTTPSVNNQTREANTEATTLAQFNLGLSVRAESRPTWGYELEIWKDIHGLNIYYGSQSDIISTIELKYKLKLTKENYCGAGLGEFRDAIKVSYALPNWITTGEAISQSLSIFIGSEKQIIDPLLANVELGLIFPSIKSIYGEQPYPFIVPKTRFYLTLGLKYFF